MERNLKFPTPLNEHGFLLAFPEGATTDIYETSRVFKVTDLVLIIKQMVSSFKPLIEQRGTDNFVQKTKDFVDHLV